MYTTRHYTSVATILADLKQINPESSQFRAGLETMRQAIGETFVVTFEDDNPRFKPDLFRQAAALV